MVNIIVDSNPKILNEYTLESFKLRRENFAKKKVITVNDYLLNATNIFSILNLDFTIFTYLGGINGLYYRDALEKNKFDMSFVNIKDNTAEELVLRDEERKISINTEFSRITTEEIRNILYSYSEIVKPDDYIVILGKSSESTVNMIIENMISIAYNSKAHASIVLDISNIDYVLKYKPNVVIADIKTLENYYKKEFSYEWEVHKIANEFLKTGIRELIVVDKKNNLTLYKESYRLKAVSEKHNFENRNIENIIAAYTAALSRGFEDDFSLSIALAASDVFYGDFIFNLDAAEIKEKLKYIEVDKFNASK